MSAWIKTSLSEFGFKCVANKHELCCDDTCVCLCHDKSKKSIIKEELKMMLREEGQILDLEIETKKEQFKMTKKTQPKLF